MIAAVCKSVITGKQMIVAGLSHENLNKLLAGRPIYRNYAEMDVEVELVIVAKEKEDDILQELRERGFLPPENPEDLTAAGRQAFNEFLAKHPELLEEGEPPVALPARSSLIDRLRHAPNLTPVSEGGFQISREDLAVLLQSRTEAAALLERLQAVLREVTGGA